MASCLGFGRHRPRHDDRQPLLPQFAHDDTLRQQRLHAKFHVYQMLNALTKGFVPSTTQLIILLRSWQAGIQLDAPGLSPSGQRLLRSLKLLLAQCIDLLQHKNAGDEVQDFCWFLSRSKLSVDVEDVVHQAQRLQTRANATAGNPHLLLAESRNPPSG